VPIVGPESSAQVCETLLSGGAVALPTETVYGLACNALDPSAVALDFDLKGRPATNPLIVHVRDAQHAASLAGDWPPEAELLSARFWPGPLTLVVAKGTAIPLIASAGLGTVGLRSPAHPVFRGVMEICGLPLAAPSANRSGSLSPTTAEAALEAMGLPGLLVMDGGPCTWGIESTVLDVSSGTPEILRPGPIGIEELEACLGRRVEVGGHGASPRSPGQIGLHYAPRTPLRLADRLVPADVGLTFEEPSAGTQIQMPADPVRYGAMLFASLRVLDSLGARVIVVQQPPQGPSWAAVNDRLQRASLR